MSSKPVLKLDWCSHAAAKYAVEHWHYSRKMVPSKSAKLGVWEDNRFIGSVVFGVGAVQNIGSPYGLLATQACELVRVALADHITPVTRIVSVAIRMLRAQSPKTRLIVSYADPNQGHTGAIYQGGNWIYVGTNMGSSYSVLCPDGQARHARAAIHKYGSCAGFRRIDLPKKHKYLYPLDGAMREQIAPLAKPYPKRPRAGSIGSDATTFHGDEGGATPTPALHDTATRESVAMAAD